VGVCGPDLSVLGEKPVGARFEYSDKGQGILEHVGKVNIETN
jgi:hypothetical protein